MSTLDATSRILTTAPMVGEVIDRKYKLVALIGEGGMGAVYEARHTETGRRVALKVIRGEEKELDAERVRRFQREARAAAAVDTQHITQVLDAGTDPASGLPYLVLEYLSGEDLQQLLDRVSVLRPSVAIRIAAQACLGLAAAHEAGVLHRDIKPANLFLARGEEGAVVVKILDFGIAKMKREGESAAEVSGLTRTGALLGSPRYMSPEQARSRPGIDHRTDLWSLGVVLYRALSGHVPHENANGLGGLIVALCTEPVQPIQQIAPWVPPEVAALLGRALQIDPAARIGSAAEMLAALKGLLPAGLALYEEELVALDAGERASAVPQALITTELVSPETSAPVEPPRPRRRLGPLGAVLAIGLAGLGAGVYASVPSAEAPSGQSNPAAPPAESTPPPAPEKASSAPPVPAPTASAEVRSVSLAVLPPGVSVEVDGSPVTPTDGKVVITGALGSTHRVRLSLGHLEDEKEVAITDSGALPAKMVLNVPPRQKENPLTPSTFQ